MSRNSSSTVRLVEYNGIGSQDSLNRMQMVRREVVVSEFSEGNSDFS
jgi:hypothetical protein